MVSLARWPVLLSMMWLLVSSSASAAEVMPSAEEIINSSKLDGGLAMLVSEDVELASNLAERGTWLVHLLTTRLESVDSLRDAIHVRGLGGRVVVHSLRDPGRLPHPARFVNLFVADLDQSQHELTRTEIERVLAVRGAAYLREKGAWRAIVAPADPRLGEWTHRFNDAGGNCVSRDRVAGMPRAIQWQHGPALEDGTADGKVPRIADGRMVTFDGLTGDLVCRDAGNGSLLWRKWIGSRQTADLAIVAGQIYLYFDEQTKPDARLNDDERGPLVALNLASGKLIKTYTEALRAGTAAPVPTEHHENPQRLERYNPVPWFIVRDDVIVQAYGRQLLVLDRVSGERRFSKELELGDSWFSPVLSGDLLLAAEAVGTGRRGRHDGATHVRAISAFDLKEGRKHWRKEEVHPLRDIDDKNRGSFTSRAEFKPLSVADGLVLIHVSSYQFRHGGRFAVLEADSGRELWSKDYKPGELYDQGSQRAILRRGEIVILDGLGARRFHARTGETIGAPIVLPKEQRRQARVNGACTASRATEDWLICNAYLYVGTDGKAESCFGARGACGQGVVPANGLMFVAPTPCDCGDYTRGYEAMAASLPGLAIPDSERLVRGPAYDAIKGCEFALPKHDWPMFLGGMERRSSVEHALPETLAVRWREDGPRLNDDALEADRRQSERHLGALSAPVAANGIVVVAAPEAHQVIARDAKTGKPRWVFHPGGKVDSPPTLLLSQAPSGSTAKPAEGLAIFGCDDGAVYAVRLSDGKLAWRFFAAPTDGLAMQHGHLASAMPLAGSVLVLGDTVLIVAGHHTDLSGLHCWALAASTGGVRAKRVIAADQLAVVTNDILVADSSATSFWLGNGQSMLHLDLKLESLSIAATKTGAAANRPAVAFDRQGSRIRFRTDIGRGGSTHGWKGAMQSRSTAAHRIVCEGDITFALRDPTASDRHPVRANQMPLVAALRGSGQERRELWTTSIGALGSQPSYSALIKAGDRLYIGGGARNGSTGFIQVLDVKNGNLLVSHEMPSRVTECGIAAAEGRLLVCCEGGQLLALEAAK